MRRQTGAGCDGDPGSLSGSGDLGDGGEEDWLGLQNGTSERVAKTLPGPLGSLSPAEPSDRAIPRVSDGPEVNESGEPITGKVGIAPLEINVWNPAFDITPHELIDGIITEEGVFTKSSSGEFQLESLF